VTATIEFIPEIDVVVVAEIKGLEDEE